MSESLSQSPQPPQEEEIWKTHSSGYEVSSFGRVKGKLVKFLTPNINNDGYPVVGLCIDNKATGKSLHRLVAETFIGDIPLGMVVNHKDGDKLNPHLSNLEIISCKDNSIHAYKMGLYPYNKLLAETVYNSKSNYPKNIKRYKVDEEIVKVIFSKRSDGDSVSKISKELNLPEGKIYRMLQFGYEKSICLANKTSYHKELKVDKLPGENWKIHPDTGYYVSDLGRVVGFFGKILNPVVGKRGYSSVLLCSKRWSVHRLVWTTFKSQIPPKMEINHLNRNKSDNRLINLEMVTHQENTKHCCSTRKILRGSEHKTSKLSEESVKIIKSKLVSGVKANALANEYGVSKSVISSIKNNKTWAHIV